MKENKIMKVVERSGERIVGSAAEVNDIKGEKVNITVEIGDAKRTFEDLELAVMIGLQLGDEADRMCCMVNGSGSVYDFAKILNGMRRAIGDRMFMKAVVEEAILEAAINAEDGEDGEEEE